MLRALEKAHRLDAWTVMAVTTGIGDELRRDRVREADERRSRFQNENAALTSCVAADAHTRTMPSFLLALDIAAAVFFLVPPRSSTRQTTGPAGTSEGQRRRPADRRR